MTQSDNRIVIVGGGLGGLTAACTLAARGHSVTLLEKNEWLGGKAAVLEAKGFRFDMGPTILTLPSVLQKVFAEAGRPLSRYVDLRRLSPQWRCFFSDGSKLDLDENLEAMLGNLRRFSADSAEGYRRFMEHSEGLHDISDRYFFWKAIGGLGDMFDAPSATNLQTIRDVLKLRMGRSVASMVRGYVRDGRVAQMIDHFTQYVGSAPDQSPAVLCGIGSMQTKEGIWYPIGGTAAVPKALHTLARELGVTIRTGTGVRRIRLQGAEVAGVETEGGEFIAATAVIANSDTVRSHSELIGGIPAKRFERRRKYEAACSGVVLYLGLKKRFPQLQHHNFVFSSDPHEEFEYIYRKGEPAPDPTCYVCAPAMSEDAVAPKGGEALYVLVHTPYLRPHHDWSKMLPSYRGVILDKLRRVSGLEDLERQIAFEHVLTPEDIHNRYRVLNGAIYGLASHGRFTGAFKPSNRSPDVRNLYFAGGSAHPGPGMPMAIMSGWIAADACDRDRTVTSIDAVSNARRQVAV